MSDGPANRPLRERADPPRLWFWLLVSANRWAVAGGLAFAIFLAFVGAGVAKGTPLAVPMESSDMLETVFAGLLGSIIMVTTLVVTINQLVLSQEIGSLGTQSSRMDKNLDVHRDTETLFEAPAPSEPAAYLDALVESTQRRALAFRDTLAGDAGFEAPVDEYVGEMVAHAEHIRERLDGAAFGTYAVVRAGLDYGYSQKLHEFRRLGTTHSDMTDEQREALDDLIESIRMYAVVRAYVKDLYLQWALVKLSRAILYAAVVALTVAGGMVVFVDAGTFPGTFLGVESLLLVVSAAFAVSVLPFLLFTAYILRLATIAKQTLPMGPLVLNS